MTRNKVEVVPKWANRIVAHGEEAPDQLLANPKNWRIHPKPQQDALGGVLKQVGIVDTVLVNQRTGFVVDGHLRVAMAISAGQKTIPVTYVDLSEEEEALILATLDPIGALAVADKEQLDALLQEIETDDAGLKALLEGLEHDSPFGTTSTERNGQGVNSTWDQVKTATSEKVVIGDIETRLDAELVARLRQFLVLGYERDGSPIHETLARIITEGIELVENCHN